MSEEKPPLAIDLALSFGPAWARESDSQERFERLARQHGGGEEERPRRGGNRGDHERDRRPPRRDSSAPKSRREPGRGPRPERAERTEPRRAPELTGWEVKFTPDRHGVEGLAKQIRSSGRAYPLFDLARLVLDKSERYVVDFRKASEDAPPLWQVKADGTLWPAESEAISQALAASLDRLYRRERTTVEPPKAPVTLVGVCGMSGTLLGPPTHHDYPARLTRLYKERFSHLPFETFKSRIRMERDEAILEKWREQESTRDVFFPWRAETAIVPETAAPQTAPEAAAEAMSETPTEVPGESPAPEIEPAPPAEPVSTDAPAALGSMAEVEADFRAHHAAGEVNAIRQKVTVPGSAAVNDSAPVVVEFARRILDELERFPLPTAQILAHQLTPHGLHVFKTPDRVTHIGPARPRFLDLAASAVSDPIRAMIEYLQAHANAPRAEQWKGLAALRPEPDAENAMARDLRWLLQQGYVIDFVKTGLSVVPKPAPPEKKAAPSKAAKEPVVEDPTEV